MKSRAIALSLAVLLLGMGGIVSADTIKMGILPVIDTLPLHVALKEGYFKSQGLRVELIPFTSAMERNTALHSRQLDGFFGDILATLLMVKNKIPLKFLTISYRTDPNQRMFGLSLSPKLSMVDPGSTLSVAISKATIIEYLLDRMKDLPSLNAHQFNPIEIKRMPIRLQMLLAGEMNAALLPEPLLTLAESKGARVIATDQTLNMPLTVLNLHAAKMTLAPAFLMAYSRAVQALNRSPEKYRALMGATCRIPKPLMDTFPVYRYPEPSLPTELEVDRVQTWMVEKALLKKPYPYSELIP